MITNTCFPCWETSNRGFLHSPYHRKQVGSTKFGKVFITDNRKEFEQWYIEEFTTNNSDDKSYYIKSKYHNGSFLCSNSDGLVYTSKSASSDAIWCLKKSDYYERGLFLSSKANNRLLACSVDHVYTVAHHMEDKRHTWVLEFSTGELCFMKSSNNLFLKCDPLGTTSLTHNTGGWEVFRFTDVEDSNESVIISSWTHFPYCLCSSSDGVVKVSDNLGGSSERWVLEKPRNKNGVLIRSLVHGRFLTTTASNGLLTTIKPTALSIWTFESANKNMFHLFSPSHKKFIEAQDPFLTSQDRREKASKWEIITSQHDSELTIRNIETGRWLSVRDDGTVETVVTKDGQKSKWIAKKSSEGGIMFISSWNSKHLGCDKYSFYLSEQGGEWEIWNLLAILPETANKAQTFTPIVTTIGAIAFAVTAPFAVMGAIGMLGFTTGGIAAGSVAAGMMSAEAIATGAIAAGGLVATLQSIGAAGLGITGLAAAVSGGAVVGGSIVGSSYIVSGHIQKSIDASSQSKYCEKEQNARNRPVCGWQSW